MAIWTEALEEDQKRRRWVLKYQALGENQLPDALIMNLRTSRAQSSQTSVWMWSRLDVNAVPGSGTERGVIMDGGQIRASVGRFPSWVAIAIWLACAPLPDCQTVNTTMPKPLLNQFIKYSGLTCLRHGTTVHPYGLSLISSLPSGIQERVRPKVVLGWSLLPCLASGCYPIRSPGGGYRRCRFRLTQRKVYRLDPIGGEVEYDQKEALECITWSYTAKNWSCPGVKNPTDYGKILSKDMWTIDTEHMELDRQYPFMHCLPVHPRSHRITDDVMRVNESLVIPRLPIVNFRIPWLSNEYRKSVKILWTNYKIISANKERIIHHDWHICICRSADSSTWKNFAGEHLPNT